MEDLFNELAVPLTRRLARMVGPDAAEDLSQEAFARAWTSAPRDADGDHMRAWMHRTARNLAVDHLRSRRLRDTVPRQRDGELVEEVFHLPLQRTSAPKPDIRASRRA
jgi:RNA polymerase sigma-70 factor (ECF subfamily)